LGNEKTLGVQKLLELANLRAGIVKLKVPWKEHGWRGYRYGRRKNGDGRRQRKDTYDKRFEHGDGGKRARRAMQYTV